MSTNPLQLRKDIDEYLDLYYMIAQNHFLKNEVKDWKKQL